jgi:hypothetical protein
MALVKRNVDGRWSMVDGRWPVVDGRWPVVDRCHYINVHAEAWQWQRRRAGLAAKLAAARTDRCHYTSVHAEAPQ